jgi:predicted small secreted protein
MRKPGAGTCAGLSRFASRTTKLIAVTRATIVILQRFVPISVSGASMTKSAVAIAIALTSLIGLSSCANTANGLAKDGREAGNALDASTHRILKAGAN